MASLPSASQPPSATVAFNIFYDPSLNLHLSKGWQLSQLLQGKVATLSANRFVVRVPAMMDGTAAVDDQITPAVTSASANADDDDEVIDLTSSPQADKTAPAADEDEGGQKVVYHNAHTASNPTADYQDLLKGMTVEQLKAFIVKAFNAKMEAAMGGVSASSNTDGGASANPPTTAKGGEGTTATTTTAASSSSFTPIDPTLATLSWGSALLVPEEHPLAAFGLTSSQAGSTLVLETYPTWAERLNAIGYAAADPKNKRKLGDAIPEEMPAAHTSEKDALVAAVREALAAGKGPTMLSTMGGGAGGKLSAAADSDTANAAVTASPHRAPKAAATNTANTADDNDDASSSVPSFTSSDDDYDDDDAAAADNAPTIGNGASVVLREAPAPARYADVALVRQARIAKMMEREQQQQQALKKETTK